MPPSHKLVVFDIASVSQPLSLPPPMQVSIVPTASLCLPRLLKFSLVVIAISSMASLKKSDPLTGPAENMSSTSSSQSSKDDTPKQPASLAKKVSKDALLGSQPEVEKRKTLLNDKEKPNSLGELLRANSGGPQL